MPNSHNPSVQIRMYRQGLGDCFLLTFAETDKEEFNMMVDCGLLQGTPQGKEIMQQVVRDVAARLPKSKTDKNKKWLDVVVLTHEHADHISGFKQAADVFEGIQFGQVWAAWMDDEGHPKYKLVRERFHKQVNGIKAALTQLKSDQQTGLKEAVESMLTEFFEEEALGAAAQDGKKSGRSPAWELALSKSTEQPRFFSPGTMFPLATFEDIRIYMLGPSEDYESFTSINPPPDDTYRSEGQAFALMESVFAAVSDGTVSSETFQPFEKRMRIEHKVAEKNDFFQTHYGFDSGAEDEWRRIDDDWLSVVGGLALNLDSYTNNTCLAFAIEFVSSGKVLLFPGDAQFSNWLSWQKLEWDVPDSAGVKQKVTAKNLLERTVFYKVGHHGSHNATLKKHGLEMMTSPDLVAMIPVDRVQARSKTSKTNPKGWEMPEKNLFERLLERTRGRVVLADEKENTDLKTRCKDQGFIDNVKFDGELNRTGVDGDPIEPLWIQVTIKG